MFNLKQNYSGKIIFVILGLFTVFLVIIASCFGILTWIGYDVLKNVELGKKNGFVYYKLINFDSDRKELTKKMLNQLQKSFKTYIMNGSLNNFNLNVDLTLNEKEFFVFLLDSAKANNKVLEDLIESGNFMLKLDKDKLIVVLPILNAFLQDSNTANYSRLESIINSMNNNYLLKNKEDYLIPNGDFYIRFVFSTEDLKFKLSSFDFNDSFVVKLLIVNEVNSILNNNDENMIYKNFFDFTDWGVSMENLNLRLSKIDIEDGYFKFTLTLSLN